MRRWFALIAAFVIAGCTTVATAEAQGVAGGDAPPLIAGRVALAEGDAQIWRVEEDSSGEWDAAIVNDVVSAGTGLYTGADGRTEVRVGPHTFRFASTSRGGFSQLDYTTAVFNLEYGTLNVRLARPEHGEVTSVTVDGTRFELVAPGRYRIDASEGGAARLTVFEGHGTVRGPGNTLGVGASQAVVVQPGAAGFSYEQAASTDFDQWALARDAHYEQVRAVQYVSPYMTGYEELDRYGEWLPDATYGVVWAPSVVPVGWAPYRHGQWRWVRPWGWTWVDHAPWGYAPFHYGRWVMVGPRWCWVPGGYVRRPVWAPALVGFVGGSAFNLSVSIGGPVVGWYPLAPWHRYEPHYRHNPTYVTIINQTVIHRRPHGVGPHVNEGHGATVVPGRRFREPIQRVALPIQPKPEQMRPVAPPPLNVAPAPRPTSRKFADQERGGPPTQAPQAVRGGLPRGQGPQAERGGPPSGQAPQRGRAMPPAVAAEPAPGRAAPAPKPVPPPQSNGPTRVMPPVAAEPTPGRAAPAPKPVPPPQSSGPTRVMPPVAADPMPGRGVTSQPPLPGNDPKPLGQPPGLKRGELAPPAPRPVTPTAPERPPPRPHLPSDQLPPGRPQPTNPAEPPRVPPGAPPTIRQPSSMTPGARPLQPSPPVAHRPAPPTAAAPARPAPPAPSAPARPAPPVAAPVPAAPPAAVAPPRANPNPPRSQKEQVLRGSPERGGRPEREAPTMRSKQAER